MRLTGLIAVLSFGLTSLFAVLLPTVLGPLIPATFILGFFVSIPLVWVLGEDFPLVASESADVPESTTAERPVAALRERYATGEIDEAEFERKLDRLLATEDLDERFDRVESDRSPSGGSDAGRERELGLE
ncbi:SHOCT domain-containing protein [Halorubrum sp. BOL3-1]|uniref:SHOCT domain-containing protein n=1 Tax=Halorubrum sp. BOL3-1 TaxID=2497325 RepID=UPI001004F26F|nr:SHOCT domain-containing protein [Halorubrum sp. BOL3-1]QAU13759.1 SHOCT domain-containing protein [Halorubrum sp. BOL3-1]